MKKWEALVEVRKLIALSFAGLFIYLAVSGKVSPEQSLPIVLMVISYYFGKSTALDRPGGEGKRGDDAN